MQQVIAQHNCTRLCAFVDTLAQAVGSAALQSSLGRAMTGHEGACAAADGGDGGRDGAERVGNDGRSGAEEAPVTTVAVDGAVLGELNPVDTVNAVAVTGAAEQQCPPKPPPINSPPINSRPLEVTPVPTSATLVALAVACSVASSGLTRHTCAAFPWPLYLIATRDSFAVELVQLQDEVRLLHVDHLRFHAFQCVCFSAINTSSSVFPFIDG